MQILYLTAALLLTTLDAFKTYPYNSRAMVCAVNKQRIAAGLNPVAIHPKLERASQEHCEDQGLVTKQMTHENSKGKSFTDRVKEAGYEYKNYLIRENVSAWSGHEQTEEVAVDRWMHSPGHKANILLEGATHMGGGRIDTSGTGQNGKDWALYWTMIIGAGDPSPDNGVPDCSDIYPDMKPTYGAQAPKPDKPKDEPKYEAPKKDEPKYEAPKKDEPKYEAPKKEEPKYEAPKEEPKYEAPKKDEPEKEKPSSYKPRNWYDEPEKDEPSESPKKEEPESELSKKWDDLLKKYRPTESPTQSDAPAKPWWEESTWNDWYNKPSEEPSYGESSNDDDYSGDEDSYEEPDESQY